MPSAGIPRQLLTHHILTRLVTTRRARFSAVAAALLLSACASSATPTTAPGAKPSSTTAPVAALHVQLDLVDRSRPAVDPFGERSAPTRSLPTELYLPAGAGRHPLIVFAPGFGGDPSKFTDLFTHWSDAGFAVASPRFPVTYTGADGSTLGRATDFREQPADLSFVLDHVLASTYRDRIDAHRIGAAGLSLGGVTTWGWIANTCCRDDRLRAAIVMDGNQFAFPNGTYVDNPVPVLVYHADHDPALPFANARAAYDHADRPQVLRHDLRVVPPAALRGLPVAAGRHGQDHEHGLLAGVPARGPGGPCRHRARRNRARHQHRRGRHLLTRPLIRGGRAPHRPPRPCTRGRRS